ncbi:uncharacterized protein LOC122382732 [Amphibalanus amphitrite]|uniref:uncharacterized protein LOC122382732 n=1 Tax=Amphibalanus amphitrite TaxID=1232801 RepID=UPI001C901B80|nr:uncharacterized protein LOC122382732 [Amphibalanus amphitrite]
MNPYSKEEKAKIVQFYWDSKSVVVTQRKFRSHFKTRKAPSYNSILRLTEQFVREGDLGNLSRKSSGRKKTTRTPENIEKVKHLVRKQPSKSSRHLAQEAGTSRTSLLRILKKDLKMKPYKVTTCQKLSQKHMMERRAFAAWLTDEDSKNPDFAQNIWFSDEAHFHLDGSVSSQNSRFWSTEKPDVVQEKSLHSSKVTVGCALSGRGIVGPVWFEDGSGDTVTVDQQRYQAVLMNFWKQAKTKYGSLMDLMWLQQDGAPPHTAKATLKWIENHFGDRLVSRGASRNWPACSPDLTPMDFFLWGHLKGQVYKEGPESLCELKREITKAVRAVPVDMCRRAVASVAKRAALCLSREGGHFEHLL